MTSPLRERNLFRQELEKVFTGEGWLKDYAHPATKERKRFLVLPHAEFIRKHSDLANIARTYHGGASVENLAGILGVEGLNGIDRLSHPLIFADYLNETARKNNWIKTVTHPITGEKQTILVFPGAKSSKDAGFIIQKGQLHGRQSVEKLGELIGIPAVSESKRLGNRLIFANELYAAMTREGRIKTVTHPATGEQKTVLICADDFYHKHLALTTASKHHGGRSAENLGKVLGIESVREHEKLRNPLLFADELYQTALNEDWIHTVTDPAGKPKKVLILPALFGKNFLAFNTAATHIHGGANAQNLARILGLDYGVPAAVNWTQYTPREWHGVLKPLVDAHILANSPDTPQPMKRAVISLSSGLQTDYTPFENALADGLSVAETKSGSGRWSVPLEVTKKGGVLSKGQSLRLKMNPKQVNWNDVAVDYRDNFRFMKHFVTTAAGTAWLAETLADKKLGMPRRFLSLGSGPSIFYERLNALKQRLEKLGLKMPKVIDVDSSREMLKAGSNPDKVEADFTKNLPVTGESIEGVEFSNFNGLGPHQLTGALEQAGNALKNDGLLYLNSWKPFSDNFIRGLESLGFDVVDRTRLDLHPDDWRKMEKTAGKGYANKLREALCDGYVLLAQKKRPAESVEPGLFSFPKNRLAKEIDEIAKTTRRAFSPHSREDEKFLEEAEKLEKQIGRLNPIIAKEHELLLTGILGKYADYFQNKVRTPKAEKIPRFIAKVKADAEAAIPKAEGDTKLVKLIERIGLLAETLQKKLGV